MDVPDVVQQHSNKSWDMKNKFCILNQWSLGDNYFKLKEYLTSF